LRQCDNPVVHRRLIRALWPLALLVLLFAGRAEGCRKKQSAKPEATLPHWITPRLTAVPVRPTWTAPPGPTRVPALPE
jgi:hypothetical protein